MNITIELEKLQRAVDLAERYQKALENIASLQQTIEKFNIENVLQAPADRLIHSGAAAKILGVNQNKISSLVKKGLLTPLYIDAERKNGYSYNKRNGRKNFYRYGRKIAAAKIAEAYMNGERAAEQNKAHHEFFYAHKLEVGNPFKVSFEITTADGREHFFSRTFETFAEAKALVDEFTATFSEPTQIVIMQNKQNGDWFYSRDTNGTEKFFDAFCKLNATEEDKPTKKATAKVDRLAELEGSKLLIYKAINNALRGHYVKLESGEFCDASEAGFTTIGVTPSIFDKLYFKDENGAYVEVSEKAIDAFNRLEAELGYIYKAIKAEIARTAVKFEVGKWYASDETDWDGNPCDNRYRILKRTKKFVTIYDYQNDDWHDLDSYDPDDEIDGEFDCIFRKKIQFDERGEYVDWRDEDGELVTLCAKDVTDKPVDEDADDDEIDGTEGEIDAAEDNVEAEIKYSCLQYKIGKYAEEIDAREKNAVRPHEPREGVPNVEGDNLSARQLQNRFCDARSVDQNQKTFLKEEIS